MPSKTPYPKLISLAVHELRTPANVVSGYLRMLQKMGGDLSPQGRDRERHMINEAERSCTRLLALVEELSELGKLDDGRTVLRRTRVDMFKLVEDAVASVTEGADREIRLELQGPEAGATLDGDSERLTIALCWIVRSVAREKPGPCTVMVDRRFATVGGTREALVVVAEPEQLDAVGSTTGEFDELRGGMGLMLPIAERIIEAHFGRISSAPGGATIRLPIVE